MKATRIIMLKSLGIMIGIYISLGLIVMGYRWIDDQYPRFWNIVGVSLIGLSIFFGTWRVVFFEVRSNHKLK